MWSKWLSGSEQDPGIITVHAGTSDKPISSEELAARQKLHVLKQHAPPPLTPQQQAAVDLQTVTAVQQAAVDLTQKLTDITGTYQSWTEHRFQDLLNTQKELHTTIDDMAVKTKATVMHIKKATASVVAAEQVLQPVPQLAESLSNLVEQVSQLQSQLFRAQAKYAARQSSSSSRAVPSAHTPPDTAASQQALQPPIDTPSELRDFSSTPPQATASVVAAAEQQEATGNEDTTPGT